MAVDERIHPAVCRAAHSNLLEETLGEYYVLASRIRMLALDREHELLDAVEEQRALLEAIHEGDRDGAARAMHRRVEAFEQAMRSVLGGP